MKLNFLQQWSFNFTVHFATSLSVAGFLERFLASKLHFHRVCGIIIFCRKVFFPKENIQFHGRRFLLFLKLPMTRRVQVCKVGVLYNTSVGCHRGSKAGGGRLESRYRPLFKGFLMYWLTRFPFVTKNFYFFDKNLGFFVKWALFHAIYFFSNVIEAKVFSIFS